MIVLFASCARADDPTGQREYAKRSPFQDIRWDGVQPEVLVDATWYSLVAIDEVETKTIVAFCQSTYQRQWKKRFEEDLVEVMTRMGHPPSDHVGLTVRSSPSGTTQVLKNVVMSHANRQAIWLARQTRRLVPTNLTWTPREPIAIEPRDAFAKRVDQFLQRSRVCTGFNGVVLVAQQGRPIYERGMGWSHVASQTPNSTLTPFRIASLSKQFTAAAVLLLESKGQLQVDDPVSKYLHEFSAAPYQSITIHQLLTHTSGLPRSPLDPKRSARWRAMSQVPTPVDDYVRLACECPLLFEPGQGFQYSNFGYRILAALISRQTGIPYREYMRKEIFAPHGLRHTGVASVTPGESEQVVAEELILADLSDKASGEPTYFTGNSGRNYGTGYGSGGIYSSASDLLRWDRVLAGDSLLPNEQREKLFRPLRNHYACGWTVKISGLDQRLYHAHSGANEGYFSKMMRIPEDGLVIIALGNVADSDEISEVLRQLFRLCRSLPFSEPSCSKP